MPALAVLGLVAGCAGHGSGQGAPGVIHDASLYFPDQQGNEWRYRGRLTKGTVEQIKDTMFVNVSTVTGREEKDGVMAVVFHDTNPGNQGPTDSYYFRDAAGLRYYGSRPGTVLERQLIPYQIMRFPFELSGSFQQLDRKNLNLGLDIDRDNRAETVDVQATVTIHGRESVTVPSGTYQDAVRMEARMKLCVHLSRDGTQVYGLDTMTAWFVKGLGLVRYTERQIIPGMEPGQERLIEITEELEEASLRRGSAFFSRRRTRTFGAPAGS